VGDLKQLTAEVKKRLWEEVQKEFPDDEMMQEVHYVRLVHYYLTETLSTEERLRFFRERGHTKAKEEA